MTVQKWWAMAVQVTACAHGVHARRMLGKGDKAESPLFCVLSHREEVHDSSAEGSSAVVALAKDYTWHIAGSAWPMGQPDCRTHDFTVCWNQRMAVYEEQGCRQWATTEGLKGVAEIRRVITEGVSTRGTGRGMPRKVLGSKEAIEDSIIARAGVADQG